MRKESEVLQAAQDGCVSKLESLFTQRQPKVLAGLFKGPNINWRDDSGCTALHLAALNGHYDAVIFLLQNDASANIPDNAGSFPLHLSAFNGHHEVAKTLLTRGPSRAQVNEPNMAGDTALHVAAQYGHRYVVQTLLENHAESHLRNAKEETPLDLAAQYGRLSTVQLFLICDVKLLQDAVHKHSPLHLAARNGHEDVVRVLLDAGMPINATCDMGTALHCAALYGKVSVAKLLLQRGIDIGIEDDSGEKVLDLLCKHPTQRSQEITALVYEHSGAAFTRKETKMRSPVSSYSGHTFEVVENKERTQSVPANSKQLNRTAGYDFVPPPRPRPRNLDDGNDTIDDAEHRYSIIRAPNQDGQNRLSNTEENFDLTSITPLGDDASQSFFSKRGYSSSDVNGKYCLLGEVIDTRTTPNEHKTKPFCKTNLNDNDTTYSYVEPLCNFKTENEPGILSSKLLTSKTRVATSFMTDESAQDSIYQSPPISNSILQNVSQSSSHPNTMSKSRSQTLPAMTPDHTRYDLYDNVNLTNTIQAAPRQQEELYGNVRNTPVQHQDCYDNVNLTNTSSTISDTCNDEMPSDSTTELSLSYDNVNITNRQSKSMDIDLTQDSYYQSPSCTILQDKPVDLFTKRNEDDKNVQYTSVKTKSMKQKRTTIIKKDISFESTKEIAVDEENDDAGKKVQTQNNQMSECSNEKILSANNDYVTMRSNSNVSDDISAEKKTEKEKRVKQNRTSTRSVSGGYRMSTINKEIPLDENYEWNKIDHFLTDLEQFAETPEDESPSAVSAANVSDWLDSMGFGHYEPMFITNGFDDMEFLGGVLEDSDLIELGILDSLHRKQIIEECNKLPCPPVIGEGGFALSASVGEWLEKLKLKDYEERFNYNGYGNMDRVRVIWELELVTVLDITTLGHRKRMLHSLGRRPPVIKPGVTWAQRFADADAGRQKHAVTDNSMEVARMLLETAESLKVSRANASHDIVTDGPPPIPERIDLDKTKVQNIPSELPKTSNTSVTTSLTTPPVQTSPTTVNVSTTTSQVNWKHCADTLLYETVSYKTQYLGSHPVQQVRGVTSTLEACKKMKAISRNVHKMPSITLAISVRGIDYIDSNSQMIISQYSINSISFCAQDPVDLHMFAYITRDEQTRKNYCHVFRADSVNLADEIILTIGQCFELAYEQHMAILEMKTMKESLTSPSLTSTERMTLRDPPPTPLPYSQRMAPNQVITSNKNS